MKVPKIRVKRALKWAGGNQSKLARRLGITASAVSAWVCSEREYLPDDAAIRFKATEAGE